MLQHSFKSKLQNMVTNEARQLVVKRGSQYKLYKNLLEPSEEWKHKDFEDLASMIKVSTSTLKRLYNKKGHEDHCSFNTNSKRHFALFLQYESWTMLEKEIKKN